MLPLHSSPLNNIAPQIKIMCNASNQIPLLLHPRSTLTPFVLTSFPYFDIIPVHDFISCVRYVHLGPSVVSIDVNLTSVLADCYNLSNCSFISSTSPNATALCQVIPEQKMNNGTYHQWLGPVIFRGMIHKKPCHWNPWKRFCYNQTNNQVLALL